MTPTPPVRPLALFDFTPTLAGRACFIPQGHSLQTWIATKEHERRYGRDEVADLLRRARQVLSRADVTILFRLTYGDVVALHHHEVSLTPLVDHALDMAWELGALDRPWIVAVPMFSRASDPNNFAVTDAMQDMQMLLGGLGSRSPRNVTLVSYLADGYPREPKYPTEPSQTLQSSGRNSRLVADTNTLSAYRAAYLHMHKTYDLETGPAVFTRRGTPYIAELPDEGLLRSNALRVLWFSLHRPAYKALSDAVPTSLFRGGRMLMFSPPSQAILHERAILRQRYARWSADRDAYMASRASRRQDVPDEYAYNERFY